MRSVWRTCEDGDRITPRPDEAGAGGRDERVRRAKPLDERVRRAKPLDERVRRAKPLDEQSYPCRVSAAIGAAFHKA
jgi:hypothetical protein